MTIRSSALVSTQNGQSQATSVRDKRQHGYLVVSLLIPLPRPLVGQYRIFIVSYIMALSPSRKRLWALRVRLTQKVKYFAIYGTLHLPLFQRLQRCYCLIHSSAVCIEEAPLRDRRIEVVGNQIIPVCVSSSTC